MTMWLNSINKICQNYDVNEIRSIINRQPKIMKAIIENGGERTKY